MARPSFELMSPRKKSDGTTHWHKIGAAFETKSGGYNLLFDSLPMPDAEGRCSVLMFPPKERGDAYEARPQQQEPKSDFNDDIPF